MTSVRYLDRPPGPMADWNNAPREFAGPRSPMAGPPPLGEHHVGVRFAEVAPKPLIPPDEPDVAALAVQIALARMKHGYRRDGRVSRRKRDETAKATSANSQTWSARESPRGRGSGRRMSRCSYSDARASLRNWRFTPCSPGARNSGAAMLARLQTAVNCMIFARNPGPMGALAGPSSERRSP